MGLLDFDFSDPNVLQGLMLLRARQGELPGLLGSIAQMQYQNQMLQMSKRKDERESRANDLQQQTGLYQALQPDEVPRMIDAYNNKRPYVPSDTMAQVMANIRRLASNPELSGRGAAAGGMPSQPSQLPQLSQSPGLPSQPRSAPLDSNAATSQNFMGANPDPALLPQLGQSPSGPPQLGGAAGGTPMQLWLAAAKSPGMMAYLQQLSKDNAPQNVRAGGTVAGRDASGNYVPLFQAPVLGPGIQAQRDSKGNVTGASGIPGYNAAAAGLAETESAAKASGALPYKEPTVVQTSGAPTLMTPAQQIEAATGKAPPNPLVVTAPQQSARNAQQITILQNELRNERDPANRAAIQKELAALSGAQSRNEPFTSQRPPGLPLQDQGAAAAQKELGQKIGSQAADVFQNGAASVQGKRMLAGMSDMAKSYTPGIFQPLRSKLAQYATGLGFSEDTTNSILNTNAGDIQGLTSAAISMAGKLTRQTDAQPSQLQFMKTLESMPSAERSAQGFGRIMDYLNGMHDYNIEKMVSLQQYLKANEGDPSGFEAQWAKEAAQNPAFIWNNAPKASAQNLKVNQTAIYKAKQAIAAGASANAVKQRLIEQGFSPAGL